MLGPPISPDPDLCPNSNYNSFSANDYPQITIMERDMRVLYVAKFAKPRDQDQEVTFNNTVMTLVKKHGAYKAHCNWRREISARETTHKRFSYSVLVLPHA